MARYDKYDPKVGGFRAPLAADFAAADAGKIFGVGLDTNGRVVKGSGNTGIVGVLVLTMAKKAGDIIDVMTAGEIVEFCATADDVGVDEGEPGTVYFADGTSGEVQTSSAATDVKVGHTVQAQRLIVRVEQTAVPAAVTWASIVPAGGIDTADIKDNAITKAKLADKAVGVAEIDATGTPGASNYLKGDGSWGTVT